MSTAKTLSASMNRARLSAAAAPIGGVLAVVLCFVFAACNRIAIGHDPPRKQTSLSKTIAPGRISVDIITLRESELFWQYQVVPSTGEVIRTDAGVGEPGSRRHVPPLTAHASNCGRPAAAPDGQFMGACVEPTLDDPRGFQVTRADGTVIYRWQPSVWRKVSGFAWSPTSKSVAVVNISYRTLGGLWRMVGATTGHYPSVGTTYVDVVEIESRNVTEYTLRIDVSDAATRIVGWIE